VDLAAEIPLPDAACRLSLLRLYAGERFSQRALGEAAARSNGTTASFAKELVRRAVLRATLADTPVDDADLESALDDLHRRCRGDDRGLLGVAVTGEPGPEGAAQLGWRG
jgi:hypothetical protein